MNVKGRSTHLIGNWYESGNAFQDVVEARNKLLEMKHNGPFALVLSPELYSLLHRVHKDTNVLEIEHVRELVTDGVFQTPVLKGKRESSSIQGEIIWILLFQRILIQHIWEKKE